MEDSHAFILGLRSR